VSRPSTGFFRPRITYRYSGAITHVEVGLALPALWIKERHGEFDTSGPYRGVPPLDLIVGVGL